MPGWQAIYQQLRDKNFEIISVAQDTNGVKDAGPWITAANPNYTALIDEKHLVSKLYNMVNVPTGVWVNEEGKIVRPNEVAFVDDHFKTFTGLDSEPYLTALKDWVEKGGKSAYAMSEEKLRERLTVNDPNFISCRRSVRLRRISLQNWPPDGSHSALQGSPAPQSQELELQTAGIRIVRRQARLRHNIRR